MFSVIFYVIYQVHGEIRRQGGASAPPKVFPKIEKIFIALINSVGSETRLKILFMKYFFWSPFKKKLRKNFDHVKNIFFLLNDSVGSET